MQSKSRHGHPVTTGGTLYFGKNSRRWSVKFCSKGDEIDARGASHPVNTYSAELSKELQLYFSKIAKTAGVKDPDTLGQQLMIIFEGAALVDRLSPGTGTAMRARKAAVTLINTSS